jgi:hypothetical protein
MGDRCKEQSAESKQLVAKRAKGVLGNMRYAIWDMG